MKAQGSIMELLDKKEELHPDLQDWLIEEGSLGPCIKHPLYYSIFHAPQMNAMANAQYRQKVKMIEEAKAAGDWSHIIWLHERPWRLQAFLDVEKHLDDKKYWEDLSQIWTDSENIWQHKAEWKKVLSANRPGGTFMEEEEKVHLASLPEILTVYRGYQKGKNFDGISYTLDKKKAEFFAKRYQRKNSNRGAIRERTVEKSKVFAYTNRRNEQEILILK